MVAASEHSCEPHERLSSRGRILLRKSANVCKVPPGLSSPDLVSAFTRPTRVPLLPTLSVSVSSHHSTHLICFLFHGTRHYRIVVFVFSGLGNRGAVRLVTTDLDTSLPPEEAGAVVSTTSSSLHFPAPKVQSNFQLERFWGCIGMNTFLGEYCTRSITHSVIRSGGCVGPGYVLRRGFTSICLQSGMGDTLRLYSRTL